MISRIKYRLSILKSLIPFTTGAKKFFLVTAAICIVEMLFSFVTPLFYAMFIENVIQFKDISKLVYVIAGYVVVYLIGVILSYFKLYSINRVANKFLFRMKHALWRGFYSRSLESFNTQNISDMSMRMDTDLIKLKPFANEQTIDYFISFVSFTGAVVLLMLIQWQLALFSVIAIPLTFYLDYITSKREGFYNSQIRECDQNFSNWLHTHIRNWREVKALGLQNHEKKNFLKFSYKRAIANSHWINWFVVRYLIIPKFKDDFIMKFAIYFIGGILIINGRITIAALLLFAQYYSVFANSLKKVSGYDAEIQVSKPNIDRVLEELSRRPVCKEPRDHLPDEKITDLKLSNVSFTYPNTNNKVIQSLNIVLTKGVRISISGKSGCGKTTLFNLMIGMLHPDNGEILYSGKNISNISKRDIHKRIGFVMQDGVLFNDTIRENLLYGKHDATDEEIKTACRKGNIHQFIEGLPKGYDTVIGERGIKLSGGQKQRLLLARVLLRDADLYLFDEATSAVDQYSENIIYDAVKQISDDKMVILVSHRKSTIELFERKMMLKDGELIEV